MIQRYFSFILFVVVTTACTDSAPSDTSAANALPEDPKITNIAETPVEKKNKGHCNAFEWANCRYGRWQKIIFRP